MAGIRPCCAIVHTRTDGYMSTVATHRNGIACLVAGCFAVNISAKLSPLLLRCIEVENTHVARTRSCATIQIRTNGDSGPLCIQ